MSSAPPVLSIRTRPWAAVPKAFVFAMLDFRAEKMMHVLNALLASIKQQLETQSALCALQALIPQRLVQFPTHAKHVHYTQTLLRQVVKA